MYCFPGHIAQFVAPEQILFYAGPRIYRFPVPNVPLQEPLQLR
jgi:hypothetical protein